MRNREKPTDVPKAGSISSRVREINTPLTQYTLRRGRYCARYYKIRAERLWLSSEGIRPIVALLKVRRRLGHISYDGLGARGWGVEMAYSTCGTQSRDALRIKIDFAYFNMETLRHYAGDKHVVWGFIAGRGSVRHDECKGLCNSLRNGEAVG